MRDRLGDGRALAVRLEIGRGRIEEFAHDRVFGIMARHFGVNVDVDGFDLGEVHAGRLLLVIPAEAGISLSFPKAMRFQLSLE
jgi:hypothetical protein